MTRHFSLLFLLTLGCGGKDDPSDSSIGADTDTDTDADTDTDTDTDADTDTVTVPEPVGDPATIELGGACPLETRYGGFVISIFELYSIVDGSVADGVIPITILEEIATEAECELLKRNNPFCDPPCGPSETCDFDGSCIPFPANQDIGTVTIGGLADPVVLTPVQPGNGYFDTSLTHPIFQPGELIELRTGGGAYDPVTLHGVGVEALVLTEPEWLVDQNQPLVFHWTPPSTPVVRSKVHVRLNIDQHGNTPIQLFCEFDDDGEGTVPQSLISQLVGAGVTGFPNATVTRRTVDQVPVDAGCMDLIVGAPVEPDIRVAGFTPCNTDADCPAGETCNIELQICE